MTPLLYYLLQVVIASGILYLYYHIALRNKKFHQYNRFYLLGAVVISVLIPFLNIPVYFTQEQTQSSFVLQTLTVISAPEMGQEVKAAVTEIAVRKMVDPATLLYYAYALLALLALVKIILSLLRISRLKKNNPVERIDRIYFINTTEPGTPFSFFHWLFWNKNIELRSEKGEQIFRHELFHIQQKHSIDLLLMELLTVVFWINPFFYLMKKELRAIHEFLADQFAVNKTDKWDYAETLLMQTLQTKHSLVNPFFHNQIKRRIAMITDSEKTRFRYLRKLLVLPLAVLITGLFAFQYKSKDRKNNLATIDPALEQTGVNRKDTSNAGSPIPIAGKRVFNFHDPLPKALIIMDGKIIDNRLLVGKALAAGEMEVYGENDPEAMRLYGKQAVHGVLIFTGAVLVDKTYEPDEVDVQPVFPGGTSGWREYLSKVLDADVPLKNNAPPGRYTVSIYFIVDKNGKVKDIAPITKLGYGMEQEVMRVIKTGPDWIPALVNGEKVESSLRQKFTFQVLQNEDQSKSGNLTDTELIAILSGTR